MEQQRLVTLRCVVLHQRQRHELPQESDYQETTRRQGFRELTLLLGKEITPPNTSIICGHSCLALQRPREAAATLLGSFVSQLEPLSAALFACPVSFCAHTHHSAALIRVGHLWPWPSSITFFHTKSGHYRCQDFPTAPAVQQLSAGGLCVYI